MDVILTFLSSLLHIDIVIYCMAIQTISTGILMAWPVEFLPKVRKIFEFLSGNWFHAKNATTDAKTS